MFILSASGGGHGDLIVSATDIVSASACEFGAVRSLDALLGRRPRPEPVADAMLELVSSLGDKHERDYLEQLKQNLGPGAVYEVDDSPAKMTRQLLQDRHAETMDAIHDGRYDVIYQGSFFDGRFHGRSDFLIRGTDGRWSVYDAKLARSAKSGPLLQLAAYAEQLELAGVPVARETHLLLGSGENDDP